MSKPESKHRLAVFWDFENVHEDFAAHRVMTDKIRHSGMLTKAYAFADWENRRKMAENLHTLGYDIIHIPDQRDNAADYKMAAYILDHMVHYPDTTCYVLITGDGDFKLIAGALRERGFGLWIISNPIITSSELTNLATKYSSIHTFRIHSLDCSGVGDCSESIRSISDMRQLMGVNLQEAIRAVKEAGNKPGVGNVKQVMLLLNPDFDEQALGFRGWADFLDWAESKGYIVREGPLPGTILHLPDEMTEEATRITGEAREAFDFLVRVVEEAVDEGKPLTLPLLNKELEERGLDISKIGFGKLADFVFSAETRSLVRVMAPEEEKGDVVILPYCRFERVRDWFEENVTTLFGASVKVPKDLFLEKVMEMLLDNHATLKQLEHWLKDSDIRESYQSILDASNLPFLPPFQMSLAHVLLGKGKSCDETVEVVNSELNPLGIRLSCPS
jgi:hypothetical protein